MIEWAGPTQADLQREFPGWVISRGSHGSYDAMKPGDPPVRIFVFGGWWDLREEIIRVRARLDKEARRA